MLSREDTNDGSREHTYGRGAIFIFLIDMQFWISMHPTTHNTLSFMVAAPCSYLMLMRHRDASNIHMYIEPRRYLVDKYYIGTCMRRALATFAGRAPLEK